MNTTTATLSLEEQRARTIDLLRTPDAMLDWLRDQKPDTIVADCMISPGECLAAKFLAHHGFKAIVGGTEYNIVLDGKWGPDMPLPQWFILAFVRFSRADKTHNVTAEDALAVLMRGRK